MNTAGFTLKRQQTIKALNVEVSEYVHEKTGAKHYHMASDDTNNVFMVALPTMPMTSNGVAHILEHTVLCGSEKYPVRDPFFMMIRRSLNTFMNAFTSSDWTAYPFASQNEKDFNNLLDVYLDAVFFPNIDELDFLQEGHRVEFEDKTDSSTDLTYKGVVFNEMKGAMSSPTSTLWQTFTENLYDTVTYHYNSGGEPEDIPSLTWEELKEFHSKHYHPSNATFFTYGSMPVEAHQATINERVLERFEHLDMDISVGNEVRWTEPKVVESSYALDEENVSKKTHIVVGWLLGESQDLSNVLRMQLWSSVLLDNSSSPLLKALETTDLGSAPSPLLGLEESNKEMCFVAGVEGSEPEHAQAVEQLIIDVLEDVAQNGVEPERVESVLHQMELSQREITGDQYPFGLQLILHVMGPVVHKGDVMQAMDMDAALEHLRQEAQDPGFIQKITREILDNPHRLRLTLKPDTELSAAKQAKEKATLEAMQASLTDEQKQDIIDKAVALEERQAQEDDPSILPKVGIEDIPKALFEPEFETVETQGQSVTRYPTGTNGLVYEDVLMPVSGLTTDEMQQMSYLSFMTELGAGDKDYLTVQAERAANTGGLRAQLSMGVPYGELQKAEAYFRIGGKALVRNQAHLTQDIINTLENTRFDEHKRIQELVTQTRYGVEKGITGNGHLLAMGIASQNMSAMTQFRFATSGIAAVKTVKALDERLKNESELASFAGGLSQLSQKMAAQPRQWLHIAEEAQLESLLSGVTAMDSVTATSAEVALNEIRESVNQAWTTSTQVNFCAHAYPVAQSCEADGPVFAVLGAFLRNGYLHTAVREKGGAYGGGAMYDAESASFRFFSYRDPRLMETLSDFRTSIDWMLNHKHPEHTLEEAILNVVSKLDHPSSPAGEARKSYYARLFGKTIERREAYRAGVINVTMDDLRRVTEKYLKDVQPSQGIICSPETGEKLAKDGFDIFEV